MWGVRCDEVEASIICLSTSTPVGTTWLRVQVLGVLLHIRYSRKTEDRYSCNGGMQAGVKGDLDAHVHARRDACLGFRV